MDIDYLGKVLVPIATFVAGFLISRLTMSKAERREDQNRKFELSQSLMNAMEKTFQDLTKTLQIYIKAPEPTIDHFVDIATTGERYLYQVKITCDAILTNNISDVIRDETLVPKIKDCANRTLPQIYDTLREIANKKGYEYNGELDRSKYLSIYTVSDKYWPTV